MDNLLVKVLFVDGMTCVSCERKVENALKKIDGIMSVEAKYSDSSVRIAYNSDKVKLGTIISTIENYDYCVKDVSMESGSKNKGSRSKTQNSNKLSEINQLLGVGFILFAISFIINSTIGFNFIPNIDKSVSYSALFVIGMLTSLHCVAMCGGINLSVCSSYRFDPKDTASKFKPSLLYNTGRVVSYTIIGGIVGFLGSAISFSNSTKSMVVIFSGVFMIIMGLNMINVFPWLRKFNPRMPKIFGTKITENKNNKGPFFVGLLSGLMPCGPLQAMQLYALGTGSFFAGALSMFLFSIGTVPLMFGFGALSSLLSSKYTKKMIKVSAVLVMMLGMIMINRGFRLSGISLSAVNPLSSSSKVSTSTGNIAKVDGNTQTITAKLGSGSYPSIVVQKGVPVKFNIKADSSSLNGCNRSIIIPDFDIQKDLQPGNNIIEFTPDKTGNITYTCWMGMIGGNIKVVDSLDKVSKKDIEESTIPYQQSPGGMGCCGGGDAQIN